MNILNEEKQTPLDIATERHYKRIARHLLQHGAKVTTHENADKLRNYLNRRALGFFVGGIFGTPWLWIGSGLAMSDSTTVQVL